MPLRSIRRSRSPVQYSRYNCCAGANWACDILETVFVQSLGCETTLNFGAFRESSIRHNSISSPEEAKFLCRNSVEPVQCSAVLICKTLRNPDHRYSIQPGGIDQ